MKYSNKWLFKMVVMLTVVARLLAYVNVYQNGVLRTMRMAAAHICIEFTM